MKITFKEVEVQKLNPQPGEILVITIKSGNIDDNQLEEFRKGIELSFPKNRVLVIGVGRNDNIVFSTINQISGCGTTEQNYCSDCSCGKKEQAETASNDVRNKEV